MGTMSKLKKAIENPRLVSSYVTSQTKVGYYLLGRTGYSVMPRRIAVAVNSVCNLRCIMCDIGQRQTGLQYYRNIEKGGELDLQTFEHLLNQVRSFRPVIAINLTEPLLHKDIISFVQHVTDRRMECELTTNGYLLHKYGKGLVEAGLSRLGVSIDGPPEVHDHIRGVKGSFERAYAGVQQVLEWKRALGRQTPRVSVGYAISNFNSHCLAATAEIFKRMGVDSMVFTHFDFISESMAEAHNKSFGSICEVRPSSVSLIDPTLMDISSLSEEIAQTKSKYGGFVAFSPNLHSIDQLHRFYGTSDFMLADRCSVPWINAQIRSNGDVVAGSRCFNVVMGNIHQITFRDIWNGREFRHFRRWLSRIGTTPACSRCCGIFGGTIE